MFWTVFLTVLCFLLLGIIGVLSYYLYKFIRIIFLFEDDLAEAIDRLTDAEEALDGILSMQLFFDSPEVKAVVWNAMETIRLAKFSVNLIIKNFVQRSKQKYIISIEKEPPIDNSGTQVAGGYLEQQQRQAGIAIQPISPTPAYKEGTLADVKRPKTTG